MKPGRWIALLLLGLVTLGCAADEPKQILSVAAEDIAGLVEATAPSGVEPPEVVSGVSAELPDAVRKALEQSDGPFEAVVRVLIGADGEVLGVKVQEARPVGSELADEYAASVSESVWQWQFNAARRQHAPTRSYLDLTFRYDAQPG